MESTLGMCEIALYSLLNFVPFLVIALYPFRRNLRFSEKTTALLILAVTVAQLFLGWSAALFRNAAGLISVASTVLSCGENPFRQDLFHPAYDFKSCEFHRHHRQMP